MAEFSGILAYNPTPVSKLQAFRVSKRWVDGAKLAFQEIKNGTATTR